MTGEKFKIDLCQWLDGQPPGTFELEEFAEYPKKVERLERKLEKIRIEQIKVALTLAQEGQEQANSGHITKAEEYFAKAIAISQEPNIINDYGLFLVRVGLLKKAEEKFIQLIQIGETIGNKRILAIAYGNLGILYRTR